jgi:hypothetical protein
MQRWYDIYQTKLFAAKCEVTLFHAVSSLITENGRGGTGRWMLSLTQRPLNRWGKSPWYPLNGRMGGSHFVQEKISSHLPGVRPLSLGNAAHGAWSLYRKRSMLNTQIMKQQHKGTPSKLLTRNEKCSSVYYLLRNDEAKTVFCEHIAICLLYRRSVIRGSNYTRGPWAVRTRVHLKCHDS